MAFSVEVNPKQLRLLIILLIVAAVGALYLYVFAPQAERYLGAQIALDTENSNLALSLARLKRAPDVEAEYESALVRYEESESRIPTEDKFHYIHRDLEAVASHNAVVIRSVSVAAGVVRGRYIEMPMSIAVTGAYNDILSFVEGVSDLPRIINVRKLSIAADGRGPDPSGIAADGWLPYHGTVVSATVDVTTYVRPKGGVPAEPGQKNASKR